MTQREIKISDEEILLIYEKEITLHEAASQLGMTTVSLWRRAKNLGIKWSEKKFKPTGKKIPIEEILEGKHPYFQTLKLKKRLIKEGIKQNKCEDCGIDSWMDKPIMIQLDHIDGNSHNHKIDNLRMRCPNCHSQTPTYSGKNK